MPTLVLHGDGDTVVDARNAALLAELLPDARVSIYDGLGHLFFWNEPERFAREVDGLPVLTLDRWIRDRARTTPGRVAIDFGGRELTYAELDDRSERLAAGFAAAGLETGDRVATLTGTSPEHVVVFFACAKAGLVLLPLNWRLAQAELAYQLADAAPAVLLHDEEHAEAARALHGRSAGLEELAAAGAVGRVARGRGRPAARLHVRHHGETEGSAPHARELLLDESVVRPRDGRLRRGRRPRGAAAVPLRRVERADAARMVEGRAG